MVILLSTPETQSEIVELSIALNAHLSDFDAQTMVKMVEEIPVERGVQETLVQAVQKSTGALAAIWICPERGDLLLMVGESAGESTIQTIMHLERDETFAHDKIATIIRSLLTPWFEKIQQKPEPLPSQEKEDSPSHHNVTPSHPSKPETADIGLALSAAYALVAPAKGEPVLSGGELGIEARLIDHIGLRLVWRVLQFADLSIEARHARLARFPVVIRTDFFFNQKKIDWGLSLGMIIDIARVRGIDTSLAPESVDTVRFGAAPSLFVRYRLVRRLSIWADFGVDWYGKPYQYRWNGEIVYTNGPVQPRGAVGVSIVLANTHQAN